MGWERERISGVSEPRAAAEELTALGGGTEWWRGAGGVSADVRARQGRVDTGARATQEAVGVLGRVYPAVFQTLRLLSRKLRHGKGCVV